MHLKREIHILVCLLGIARAYAGDTLYYSLPQCREMALEAGMSTRMQSETRLAAAYNRKAAMAAMFPRVTANAAYMWNNADVHLLSNTADLSFGTARVLPDGTATFDWSSESTLGKIETAAQGTIFADAVTGIENNAGQRVADAYKQIYDKLSPDLTHIFVAQVGVTQPIYAGGRLIQLYKIAKATENMAGYESDAKREQVIYNVDEAYWRVVSVAKKKELAEQYYHLLCQLEADVKEALNEGIATQSDLLKVTTKRGEAEVKKLQAENGLTLSNMALAQICGLPLGSVFRLDEAGIEDTRLPEDSLNTEAAVAERSEVRMLEEAQKIDKSNVRLAAAGLQPNIVASAGYIYTNPNVENGFSSQWDGRGFFSAGVVVNVPIAHADEILRYKAAKHAANAVALKTEETRQLLTLQTTQANQKLTEAQQKITLAQLTQANAAEMLRMAQESYEAGMITASELMQAQTAWLAAATDLVDAEADAKTTETQLRKYLGKL